MDRKDDGASFTSQPFCRWALGQGPRVTFGAIEAPQTGQWAAVLPGPCRAGREGARRAGLSPSPEGRRGGREPERGWEEPPSPSPIS